MTTRQKALVVDDLTGVRQVLVKILSKEGIEAAQAENGEQALAMIDEVCPDVVLLDKKMPGIDGMQVLERLGQDHADVPVIMITAFGDVQSAVQAIQMGAYHYLPKPFNNEEVVAVVKRALEKRRLVRQIHELQARLGTEPSFGAAMGTSDVMRRVYDQVAQVAPTNFTVIIYGETGTGKEVLARGIHSESPRQDHRFVAVDCGAIPETLIESELFGHQKGAFTGSDRDKIGQFELADGGTLFLDEIGNLPFGVQTKLLRALQERRIQRVGAEESIEVDIRVIVASNLRLDELVDQGRFRSDLYFRLNEFVIELPPLRERKDDIIFLCKRFTDLTNEELNKKVKYLSEEALDLTLAYDWPGNVRELRNAIRRAVLLCDDVIQPEHLSVIQSASDAPGTRLDPQLASDLDRGLPLKDLVKRQTAELERRIIQETLQRTQGNKSQAARLLQIDYKTLYNKMKQYGMT